MDRPSRACIVAVLVVISAALWSIFAPYAVVEPDDYSYRAQAAALRDGHLTLSKSQYQQLDEKLRAHEDRASPSTNASGPGAALVTADGIVQWVEQPDGRFISEKNPGWSFIAAGFEAVGLLRIVNALFLAVAAAAVWIATRRWIGPWAATLAVVLLAWSPFTLVFSTRVWMPTYAGAMLVATGLALAVWVLVASDRTDRARTLGLLGSVAALSIATWMRYTDVLVLASLGLVMVVAAWKGRGISLRRTLACGLVGVFTLGGIAWFNSAHYGSVHATGYELTQADRVVRGAGEPALGGVPGSPGANPPVGTEQTRSKSGGPLRTDVSFSLSAIADNLAGMPLRLAFALPQSAMALVALVCVVLGGWWRNRRHDADMLALALLAASWAAPWLLYAAYDWTARQAGSGVGGWVHTTRFYASAVGPIALLFTWALWRAPREQIAHVAGAGVATVCIVMSVAVAGSTERLNAPPGGGPPPGMGPGMRPGGPRQGGPPGGMPPPGGQPPGANAASTSPQAEAPSR